MQSQDTLYKLAKALDTTIEYLLQYYYLSSNVGKAIQTINNNISDKKERFSLIENPTALEKYDFDKEITKLE